MTVMRMAHADDTVFVMKVPDGARYASNASNATDGVSDGDGDSMIVIA